MQKVIGYVFCKKTNRVLHNPILYWFNRDGGIQEKIIGTETEGKFEIEVPEYVQKLYVGNRGYSIREIRLAPLMNKLLVYLKKS